ncbi:MAG TPA: hypothetical protein VJ860_10110 [Polyangia bacterium]|jgi:hypothetical protein|nr:hypothetical protein [Polyangia bacterium]
MLPRLSLALGLAFLAALPALCGCSSSRRRDQNYGTDVGANYQIPDAAHFSSSTGADAADATGDTGLEAEPADASVQDSDPGTDS